MARKLSNEEHARSYAWRASCARPSTFEASSPHDRIVAALGRYAARTEQPSAGIDAPEPSR